MNTNDAANDEGELDEIIILPPRPLYLRGGVFRLIFSGLVSHDYFRNFS